MSLKQGFIAFVQEQHPQMWALIRKTADETGLIVVDVENDAITATNRLLWTNPVLHECLSTLVNEWTCDQVERENPLRDLLTPREEA